VPINLIDINVTTNFWDDYENRLIEPNPDGDPFGTVVLRSGKLLTKLRMTDAGLRDLEDDAAFAAEFYVGDADEYLDALGKSAAATVRRIRAAR
tara:strand:+ start:62 stop:343 length:282 start_codon:yes stop_codon:yes gene_type:complete